MTDIYSSLSMTSYLVPPRRNCCCFQHEHHHGHPGTVLTREVERGACVDSVHLLQVVCKVSSGVSLSSFLLDMSVAMQITAFSPCSLLPT